MEIMLEKMFFFRNLLVAHYHKCVILCLQYFSITRPSAPTARNDSIPLTESARLTLLPLWATSLRGSKHPKDTSLKICETTCLVLNQRRGTLFICLKEKYVAVIFSAFQLLLTIMLNIPEHAVFNPLYRIYL